MEYEFTVAGLCVQKKALRVTLLAEYAALQSHETGHSESQKLWLFKALSQTETRQKSPSPLQQWQNWACSGAAATHFHSPMY